MNISLIDDIKQDNTVLGTYNEYSIAYNINQDNTALSTCNEYISN